jgi:hypothetical protein
MTSEEQIALIKKNPISVGCVVLSLALVGGLYFRSDKIPEAEAELTQKIADAERLATNLKYSEKLKEQLEALAAANKEIEAKIIRQSQVGINSQYFYKLESETGVKMVNFVPSSLAAPAKGAKANYIPVGFAVSVQGTLQQILDYLRLLESGSHFSRVLTAQISGNPANRKANLTLSLNLELLGLP